MNITFRDAQCLGQGEGDAVQYPMFWVGGAISLIADIIVPLGLTLQKLALLAAKKSGGHVLLSVRWYIGFFTMIFGELGNGFAYSLAPATLVAPLGAIGICSNAVCSTIFLKEPFTRSIAMGVGMDVIGIALVSFGAPAAGGFRCAPVHELHYYTSQPTFLVYACILVLGLIAFSLFTHFKRSSLLFPLIACGIAGGFSVMAVKPVASMLRAACLDCCTSCQTQTEMLIGWTFWVSLLVMCSSGFVQIKFLNVAMERFDNQRVVPVFYVIFTGFSILSSAILYQEVDWTTYTVGSGVIKGVFFILGLGFTVVGTFLAAWGTKPREPEDGSCVQPAEVKCAQPAVVKDVESLQDSQDSIGKSSL